MQYIIILYPLILGTLFLFSPKRRGIRISLNIIKTLGTVVFALVLLRVYWFDIYKIPSESMEPTMHVGDMIIIRKNTLPERNDIIVFEGVGKKRVTLVKRCIGLPGDTLEIKSDTVLCNGKNTTELGSLLWSYNYNFDIYRSSEINKVLKRSVSIGGKQLLLTSKEANKLYCTLPKIQLYKATRPKGELGKVYPRKRLGNNRDNFEPFIVPRKGGRVRLNETNILWYKKIITFENDSVSFEDNKIVRINGTQLASYVFKENYYFMMGDNRHRSRDSRFFGFIPQKNLFGKVLCRISSNYEIEAISY